MLFGALLLAGIATSSHAEPSALDEAPSTEKKPDTDKPKEKQAVTVPAGTALMVKTGEKVTSDDKPGRRFSATLQANLVSGDTVVAKAGSQVYGTVVKSAQAGRGIVASYANLVLGLTDINIDGAMYPIVTGSFSEESSGIILQRKSVSVPAGSLLEFRLTQPLTVKK
jgi:hypothetical protein